MKQKKDLTKRQILTRLDISPKKRAFGTKETGIFFENGKLAKLNEGFLN